MTPWQKQILIGTILGGSSIVKPKKGVNYYLAMAGRDETWLRYKMTELNELFQKATPTLDGNTYRCASRCSEELSELHREMYKEGKRYIRNDVLDPLRDIGLATWWLDGGGKTGRDKNNAYLNLTRMPKSVDTIINYFCTMDMHCKANISKGRIRLVFSLEGTNNFLKTIAHRFPDFMCHRL